VRLLCHRRVRLSRKAQGQASASQHKRNRTIFFKRLPKGFNPCHVRLQAPMDLPRYQWN
jgi:hypothetical protein